MTPATRALQRPPDLKLTLTGRRPRLLYESPLGIIPESITPAGGADIALYVCTPGVMVRRVAVRGLRHPIHLQNGARSAQVSVSQPVLRAAPLPREAGGGNKRGWGPFFPGLRSCEKIVLSC
jgi:hypothetical protein